MVTGMIDTRYSGYTDQQLAEWSNKATRYEAVSSLMIQPELPMWDRAENALGEVAQACLILVVPSTTKLFVMHTQSDTVEVYTDDEKIIELMGETTRSGLWAYLDSLPNIYEVMAHPND
ncbi:hypothetical protein GCM10007941_26260 [Amphritea balenae]|nr:hypothetical protein GCM10007941_26260 [Amphritea balenae]